MHDTSVLYNAIKVDEKFVPHPPKGNLFMFFHLFYLSSILQFTNNVSYLLFLGKYYVVDAGYSNRIDCLALYKGERSFTGVP
jgi:hypothetical protein